jgi:hypothetical protein
MQARFDALDLSKLKEANGFDHLDLLHWGLRSRTPSNSKSQGFPCAKQRSSFSQIGFNKAEEIERLAHNVQEKSSSRWEGAKEVSHASEGSSGSQKPERQQKSTEQFLQDRMG